LYTVINRVFENAVLNTRPLPGQRLRNEHAALVQAGQRVVLVLATDGLPTTSRSGQSMQSDKDRLTRLLREVQLELPVFLVVRLTVRAALGRLSALSVSL
jgi:hypothetical protein